MTSRQRPYVSWRKYTEIDLLTTAEQCVRRIFHPHPVHSCLLLCNGLSYVCRIFQNLNQSSRLQVIIHMRTHYGYHQLHFNNANNSTRVAAQ